MPNYPYSFQLPPLNVQDIPNDGVAGEFLGISAGGVLDWLPVAGGGGGGDMLKADNLSGLADYAIARTNIGLGTTSTPTFANLTLTSPSLASSAPVTISQTWNGTVSTVFTALKVNAVSTVSSTSSYLLDLQVGGVSQFSVQRNGTLRMTSTDAETKLSYSAAGFLFFGSGAPSLFIGQDGTGNGNAVMGNTGFIGFSSAFTAASGNADTRLYRDSASGNTLALRNGALPQTFRVYNTYSNAGDDYERCVIGYSSNVLKIGQEKLGTGTDRGTEINGGLYLNVLVQSAAAIGIGGAAITFSKNLVFGTDNSYDIGASTGARPKDIFLTGTLYSNTIRDSTTGVLNFVTTGSTRMTINGTGNVGIGTTAPTSGLHVAGALGFDSTTYNSAAALKLTNTTGPNSWLLTSGIVAVSDSTFCIRQESTAIPALTIANNTNNVGIGTSVPAAKLHVAGNGRFSGAYPNVDLKPSAWVTPFLFQSGTDLTGTGAGVYTIFSNPTAHGFSWVQGSTSRIVIDTTGNVGIGTTSPSSKLDVAGAVTAAGYFTATSGGVSLVANGLWQQGTGHLTLASGAILGWSGQANVNIDQPGDTRLLRDEAYHLALRNGTNGQKFSVYGTYPGAAWERFTITAPTSGNVLLGTYKGTGGIARGLEIQTDGVTRISFDPASVNVTFQGAILTATANQTIVRTGANSILAASNDGTIRAIKLRGDAGGALGWASGGDPTGGLSAAIMQVSAGVLALGDGTLNSVAGSLNLTNINAVGNVISRPSASITPAANGDLVVEATSNTTLTFKLKGTDGTVRTGTITLA